MRIFLRKPDTFDYSKERVCLTCNHHFAGKYCARCGEKVIEPYDRSFRNFFDSVFNAFTFIDGKFVRSFKKMLLHPGRMSSDIAVGIRQPYMKLVPFFFVANFIYFLLPIFETFNTTLTAQMNYMKYQEYAQKVVNQHLAQNNLTLEEFMPVYNAASTNLSKLLLVLLAILFFPFTVVVNYSRKNYLSDHFYFSMEYTSYLIFVPTILFSFILMLVVGAGTILQIDLKYLLSDKYIAPGVLVLIFYFLIIGIRNFYQFPWWRVALNAIILTLSMIIVIEVYRFILFMVTMWTT